MKKYVLLFIVLLISVFSVRAQKYIPSWGEKIKRHFNDIRYIDMNDDHYYLLNAKYSIGIPYKYVLYDYNLKHELEHKTEYSFFYNGEKIQYYKTLKTSSGIFCIFSNYDRTKSKMHLFVSSFENGQFGEIKELHDYEYKNLNFLNRAFKASKIDNFTRGIKVSKNKKCVLLLDPTSYIVGNTIKKMSIAVYDSNMNLSWKKEQEFELNGEDLAFVSMEISNDGVVYLLGKLAKSVSKKKNSRLSKQDFRLYRIDENDMGFYDVILGESQTVTDAIITIPDVSADDFLVTGLYTDTVSIASNSNGTFSLSGNSLEGFVKKSIDKFSDEFLEGIIKDNDRAKGKGIDERFSIIESYCHLDQSNTFIVEFLSSSVARFDEKFHEGLTQEEYVVINSGDILLYKYSSEGNLLYHQKIEKSYQSTLMKNGSYLSALYNDKIYFLLNNNKQTPEILKSYDKIDRPYTDLVIINNEGVIEFRKTIFNQKSYSANFFPTYSKYKDGKMLLISMRGFHSIIGLLNLNE